MERRCMGCMELYDQALDICPHCGYEYGTPALEAFHILPGEILAQRYIVGRVLGSGGFGVTYIGYDQVLQKKVAIKEYLPGDFATRMPEQAEVTIYSGEREEQFLAGREKFIDEARKLAKFQSQPGIVQIFDCFETNRTAYIIMEFLDGISVKEKLARDGRMTVEEALPIILEVTAALKAVHSVGILHRDIAPDNIYLLKNGQTKLLDFGAARFAANVHSKSLSVLIKPGFAPVEQYRSRGDQGPWTDVYSLAATFYNMLTGQPPEDAMERLADDTLKPPSKLGVKISPSLEAALMNALNIQVENRTRTINRFEQDLQASSVKRVTEKKKKDDLGKWPLWAKVVLSVGIVAVVGGAGAAILFSGKSPRLVTVETAQEGQLRVPNLVNQSFEDARAIAEDTGLTVIIGARDYDDIIAENMVLRQDKKAGDLTESGTEINLTISAGIRKTYVPDILGLEKDAAMSLLDEAGLIPVVEEKEYRAAPNTVAEQGLAPETECKTGTQIPVVISLGIPGGDESKSVEIPQLAGMEFDTAADLLLQDYIYLIKAETQYSNQIPEGIIISQETAPGTSMNQNSQIRVTVSLGQKLIRIPNVQYMTEAEARTALGEAGLDVQITYETSQSVERGKIIAQSLEADSKVASGTQITLTVSSGRPAQTNTGSRPAGQTGGGSNTGGGSQPPAYQPTQPPAPQPTEPPDTQPQETQEHQSVLDYINSH